MFNPETKLSNAPVLLITISGALSVSFHSSDGGVNSIVPAQLNTSKGLMFKVLLAKVVQLKLSSVYGKVKQSPVFW